MDSLAEVTRRASLTTNNLPLAEHINNHNAAYFEQKNEPETSLAVPQQVREFHSLPEANITLKPVQTSRPHSDTDVTMLSSKPPHVKGDEKIDTEEPCFESLSFSYDVDNEEQYYPYSDKNTTTTVDVPVGTYTATFHIPESPTTPKMEDILTTPKAKNSPSSFLILEDSIEATQNAGMSSRKLVGSSTDLSYHLRNGEYIDVHGQRKLVCLRCYRICEYKSILSIGFALSKT